jgi:glycosyltransferase involved in cell wall biosynthesis
VHPAPKRGFTFPWDGWLRGALSSRAAGAMDADRVWNDLGIDPAAPAAVYRALDVVVHANTHPEPVGRTIVEAMSCARPVIVSAEGGAAELFTPGLDAGGFEPGNLEALAAALHELVGSAPRRAEIGQSARQTAVARFARERLGREVAAIYDRWAPARARHELPVRPFESRLRR